MTRKLQVLHAMSDWGKYWGRELNKKARYYKACTRASELCKDWLVKVVSMKEVKKWVFAHQYTITNEWLLKVWVMTIHSHTSQVNNEVSKTKKLLNTFYSLINKILWKQK